tara:strand:- start:526 stop:1497 length:972 start_codon:yes stop_codon:yes gene_type:complete
MKKFTDIAQFRNVIRELRIRHDYKGKDANGEPIYQHTEPYPTVKFKGTVKLHGTNAGIVLYAPNNVIEFQSRESILSLDSDNAGFMREVSAKKLNFLFDGIEFNDYLAVYGEWCGGNIQKGVAINGLPKMFVIFACKVDGQWIDFRRSDPSQGIYNINDFQTYEILVDFNVPELSQNKIIELTIAVEEECPVGKFFGVSGIGEGIVFTANHDGEHYMFKSKGEKHSVTKVKTIAAVDVEQLESMNAFVDYSVTENRLNQGLEYMRRNKLEITQKNTGEFLRWVVGDIAKEETDVMEGNKLDQKKINPLISTKARQWYFNNLEV